MHDYQVFGGRLRCDLELVGVPHCRSPGRPDWLLSRQDGPLAPVTPLAHAELVEDGFTVQLFDCDGGWRLAYSDTGTYEIATDGASIFWHPGPAPVPELVQADILGRVLALALSAAGAFPLHGSAVSARANSIVVLGNKHEGKSTLAGALLATGARLVSDDMVAIELGPELMLRPGVPQLRLWPDSADRVLAETESTRTSGVKETLSGFAPDRVELRSTSLCAIYVLDPTASADAGAPVARTRLRPTDAALALLSHGKMGGLLCGTLAWAAMQRAAEVVRRIPVYSLRVVRDLDRLPQVADLLLDWHHEKDPALLERR